MITKRPLDVGSKESPTNETASHLRGTIRALPSSEDARSRANEQLVLLHALHSPLSQACLMIYLETEQRGKSGNGFLTKRPKQCRS